MKRSGPQRSQNTARRSSHEVDSQACEPGKRLWGAAVKTKKLLARLRSFLDAERGEQIREMDSVRAVLHDLRAKQRKFEAKLAADPTREDRDEIEGKLWAIRVQRRKGLERLRELSTHKGRSEREE